MEGAAELDSHPEGQVFAEDREPEPALESSSTASRGPCGKAALENSNAPQCEESSSPPPAPSETDVPLRDAGQPERAQDAGEGQQISRDSPPEFSGVSVEDLTQPEKDDTEVRDALASLQNRVRELEIQRQKQMDSVAKADERTKHTVESATQKGLKHKQELNALRAERDEALRSKKEHRVIEDGFRKRKADMESKIADLESKIKSLKAEVNRLRIENAEVRAEALSLAESVAKHQGDAKREKNDAKRAQGWEKQKARLQEDISREKRKLTQLQQVLDQEKERHLQAEVRWRQEEKTKEEAVARADKEKRAREQAEAAFKRREEATRRKAEQDKQRLRDDVERLTQELSTLRAAESAHFVTASWDSPVVPVPKNGGSKLGLLEPERHSWDERRDRECVVCLCEEMLVVFLPCAHQVVCIKCNELHEKEGMRDCPACRTPIQQRIRVYGASC